MKGIVFTEFMEMVEASFGFSVANRLVQETNPASGGVYTAIGTYDHKEIVAFVIKLSEISEISVPDLLRTFGNYLFNTFTLTRNELIQKNGNTLSFLESVEGYIHVEVLKLYPKAELPRFVTKRLSDTSIEMIYNSDRAMWPLAEGLIQGCAHYYGEQVTIKTDLLKSDGSQVKFLIDLVQ